MVYISIIFLFYFVLLLLKRSVENSENITKFVRESAIENSQKKDI
ncbi:MAG: hypothetical protein LBQ59_05150, partial [Candidatus Peribacteria bacterium]|nr:hypothetical protein [Candidatus Peribacteria bacterium]